MMQVFTTMDEATEHIREILSTSEGTYDCRAIADDLYSYTEAVSGYTSMIVDGEPESHTVDQVFWDIVIRHEIVVPDAYLVAAEVAYIACLLWTALDDQGDPLPEYQWDVDDIATSEGEMYADLHDFLGSEEVWVIVRDSPADRVGHHFALTRNSHGTGFWDSASGFSERQGSILTRAAKVYGGASLYVGDDGKVHYQD